MTHTREGNYRARVTLETPSGEAVKRHDFMTSGDGEMQLVKTRGRSPGRALADAFARTMWGSLGVGLFVNLGVIDGLPENLSGAQYAAICSSIALAPVLAHALVRLFVHARGDRQAIDAVAPTQIAPPAGATEPSATPA